MQTNEVNMELSAYVKLIHSISTDLKSKVHDISPLFGPVSGGTRVTVHGQELELIAKPTVYIGNLLCKEEKGDHVR